MEKILYRPNNAPIGTPYRVGYATYTGQFVEIGPYRGAVVTTIFKVNELEIISYAL